MVIKCARPVKGISPTIIIYFFALSFFFSGCDIINPEEEIPGYVVIENYEFSTETNDGSAHENITEVWVFINNEYLGVFPIPAKIPVLSLGNINVRIEPGIKENGISSTPDINPFYTTFERDINLTANQEVTINPRFTYKNTTRFAFIDAFERNTLFSNVITGTEISRVKIDRDTPFEGDGSGQIDLAVDDPFVEIATAQRFSGLLDNELTVYLEVSFRSEVPVSFGAIGYLRGQDDPISIDYRAGFNASEDWKKIYFNLTPILFGSDADEFQIILRTSLPLAEDGTFALTEATVELDNIKLVHF
ncbi:MAG: hypothetical protein AAF242_17625 [Bacteroidota bacterium]